MIICFYSAPPQRNLSVSMRCDTLLEDGRPISINWTFSSHPVLCVMKMLSTIYIHTQEGGREVGVVYPGEELVLVELTSPSGTVEQLCSDVNGCSSEISENATTKFH